VIRGGARPGLVVGAAFALAGCATVAPAARKLPDGSYEIACAQPLATCLQAFENLCTWHGYDVISAAERRQRADLRDPQDDSISSEARVRCKSGEPLFGRSPTAGPTAPATPAPPPAPSQAPAPPAAAEPSAAVTRAACSASTADGGAPACGGSNPGRPRPELSQ
jgi:hypothetical protein